MCPVRGLHTDTGLSADESALRSPHAHAHGLVTSVSGLAQLAVAGWLFYFGACGDVAMLRGLEAGPAPARLRDFALCWKKMFPSIYQIFRAPQNTNRWRIIDTMFAKFQPCH